MNLIFITTEKIKDRIVDLAIRLLSSETLFHRIFKKLCHIYRYKMIKLDGRIRGIPNIIALYFSIMFFILSSIIYIGIDLKKEIGNEVMIPIEAKNLYAGRDRNTIQIKEGRGDVASEQGVRAADPTEKINITEIIDDDQRHFFRQHAVGSKIFIYNGFIDILFDEESLDVELSNIRQNEIESSQPKPRNDVAHAINTVPNLKSTPVRVAKKVDVALVAKKTISQAVAKNILKPEIKDLLSDYKITEYEDGFRVVVPGVDLFAGNSDQLSRNALIILKPIAETAQVADGATLTIVGHTDSIKGADASRALSLLRAELVKDFLSGSFGINADRMEVLGEGKGSPIASNSTLDGRQANRRVEISFGKR